VLVPGESLQPTVLVSVHTATSLLRLKDLTALLDTRQGRAALRDAQEVTQVSSKVLNEAIRRAHDEAALLLPVDINLPYGTEELPLRYSFQYIVDGLLAYVATTGEGNANADIASMSQLLLATGTGKTGTALWGHKPVRPFAVIQTALDSLMTLAKRVRPSRFSPVALYVQGSYHSRRSGKSPGQLIMSFPCIARGPNAKRMTSAMAIRGGASFAWT
jgi:hypothetical protein